MKINWDAIIRDYGTISEFCREHDYEQSAIYDLEKFKRYIKGSKNHKMRIILREKGYLMNDEITAAKNEMAEIRAINENR